MQRRAPVEGYCGNIPEVLGASWFPGRLIYRSHRFVKDGREFVIPMALCPACGKWADVRHDDSLVAHKLPGGTDANRRVLRLEAQDRYGQLVAVDRMRDARVA